MTLPDRRVYEGTILGKQFMMGRLIYPNGTVEEGNFYNGETLFKSPVNQLDVINQYKGGVLVNSKSVFDHYLTEGDFNKVFKIRGEKPYLGIAFDWKNNAIVVQKVAVNGPAFLKGIKQGDLIVKANGLKMSGNNQFLQQVMNTGYATALALSIQRKGIVEDITVYPSIRPSGYSSKPNQIKQNSFNEMFSYYESIAPQRADEMMIASGVSKALLDEYKNRREQILKERKAKEICKINEPTWLYEGPGCQDGVAHGQGIAISLNKDLQFKGEFKNGNRVNGIISASGVEMYDGPVKNGRPEGEGICFYQGEPEKCEYYRGKRVDVLFKQRIELTKQQQAIDQKLQKMEQSQNARIMQMQNQMQNQTSQTQATPLTGGMKNALIEEGQKRIAGKIFDQLF